MDNRNRARAHLRAMRERRNGPLQRKRIADEIAKKRKQELEQLWKFCPIAAECLERGDVKEAQRYMLEYIKFRGKKAEEQSGIDFSADTDQPVYDSDFIRAMVAKADLATESEVSLSLDHQDTGNPEDHKAERQE